ncbi:hydrogenase nickel incorporation protein HypB [candidate division KSB1 bacterium]|nr:hydrogenase nickel incorporation protein HypB [candidate division KSB1 bacterium]
MNVITIERKILEKNEDLAKLNRETFKQKNIFVLDLLSSPGSGKTSILEKTLETISKQVGIAVIEGDVQTDNDAQRIAKHNVPVVQIITMGGCHLDAQLVRNAMDSLPLDEIQLLFIENVGNLVCPAEFDLGEHEKVVILSTTEGDDKPLKYPAAFRNARTCILNKTDLLPHVDFSVEDFKKNALKINPNLTLFEMSAKTGEGIEAWTDWLTQKIKNG